jgi:protein-disulfide isomerase
LGPVGAEGNLDNLDRNPLQVWGVSPGTGKQTDDLTRKERRDQARAQRKAVEEAQRASATRRRRLYQLGGLVGLVVVIIVVVVVATSGGGGSSTGIAKGHEANQKVAEVTSLLNGIPQQHNTLGNPNAPVTLEYYGDLECPICRDFTLYSLPTIIKEFVRTGKLKIEYHSLETATREPSVFKQQQVAALAAGQQKKMWDYLELFYHEQGVEDSGYVNEGYLQGLAQQVPGLNLVKWTASRGESSLPAEVEHDAVVASEHHFEGTPSFLLGKTGTTLTPLQATSFTEPAVYAEAIKKYL